jgi:tRNA-specific 2-thiouridylase
LAKKLKLPNADKKESMGLCFVGKIRLKDFLEQKLKAKRGSIVDTKGNVLGKHEGLHYYTLGQRQGINIGSGGPWYVAKKRLVDNTLIVTNNPKDKLLQIKELEIHSVNWIAKPKQLATSVQWQVKLKARYRHQGEFQKVTLSPVSISSSRGKPAQTQSSRAKPAQTQLSRGKLVLGVEII